MKATEQELLLLHLDGKTTPSESKLVSALLRKDPEARAFLRETAEQAVMVSDVHQMAGTVPAATAPMPVSPFPGPRRWALAAALAACAALAAFVFRTRAPDQAGAIRISKVMGANQYFGSVTRSENSLTHGTVLRAGDTVETRSCDAWIELTLPNGTLVTLAGQSSLRILNPASGQNSLELVRGSLWVNPSGPGRDAIRIHTPTLLASSRGAQLDIQTSTTDTQLRVNAGVVHVSGVPTEPPIPVENGHQIVAALNRPLMSTPQPAPIGNWSCDFGRIPEVVLGKWLPSAGGGRPRLAASPLLWPVPGRESVLLHAVAIAAWKSTDQPVLLHSGSELRFRGRTERPERVRFGFSAQRMRGVFAGKFEMDVPASALGSPGIEWEARLKLSDFRPLHPQLAASPEGLELTDVYALTIRNDVGLEIHHMELIQEGKASE